MAVLSHSFPLPEFEKLPDADIEVFEETLRINGNDTNAGNLAVIAIKNRLTPRTRTFYDGNQSFYESTRRTGRFRTPSWHVDGQWKGLFSLFASSTTPTYASFDLEANVDKLVVDKAVQQYYERREKSFDEAGFMPAEVITILEHILLRSNWLEKAGGLEKDDGVLSRLEECGVQIGNLAVVQTLPYVVARGNVYEIVHTSSLLGEGAPDTRILSRSL